MDTTDNSGVSFEGKSDYRQLPAIVDLAIRVTAFKPPALKHFQSGLAALDKALEFTVTVDGPIPVIASSPALYIGDSRPIPVYEEVKEKVYRFLAFEWDHLKPGEPIFWGWDNDPPERRVRTKFRFQLPG